MTKRHIQRVAAQSEYINVTAAAAKAGFKLTDAERRDMIAHQVNARLAMNRARDPLEGTGFYGRE